jgi:fibronectin-binding autotransporter adhesin
LNYAGKFDFKLPADDAGSHPHAQHHVLSASAHAPSDSIIVPDANLLFNGDFKRAGVDLILSHDDQKLVLHDYFKGEKHAPLASPDGANLSGDIVSALTGYVEYSQADNPAAAAHVVIGHVTKLTGSATATRNGVSVILNNGDNVEKGDVVATGSDSTLGITFIDGTVFGLSHNARMVLNEMVYDPNGSNNSSLMSLVAGTISFVAGETAKHGDMKVDTPVATMGIRGTAILCEMAFDVPGNGGVPEAEFQLLIEPDGTWGSMVLLDKNTLAEIARADKPEMRFKVDGSGHVSSSNTGPLSADAQKVISDVFTLKFTDLFNSNTKTTTAQTDSIIPSSFGIKLANGDTIPTTVFLVNTALNSAPPPIGGSVLPHLHSDVPPTVTTRGNSFTELPNTTGSDALDTVSGAITFNDINLADRPTAKATFSAFAFENAQGTDVTASLSEPQNAQLLADIKAIEVKLAVVANAGNTSSGGDTWTYSIPDHDVDFLAAGETLKLTYTIEVDTNYAAYNTAVTQNITITITGTNDAPVITSGVQTVDFAAGTSTVGGNLAPIEGTATSGTLKFTDVDLDDTHTVSVALTGTDIDGNPVDLSIKDPGPLSDFEKALSVAIAAGNDSTGTGSGTINWTLAALPVYDADLLAAGQTLTLTYTVTVTDEHGATSTQEIVVTITGLAPAAVVWKATTVDGTNDWNTGSNWESGKVPDSSDAVIIITDQLHPNTPLYPVEINAAAFAYSLTMNDYYALPPVLDNNSTLAIGAGGFSVNADSIVNNSVTGIITVAGVMDLAGTSQLTNAGIITLADGGDFSTSTTITNSGTIEVSGGTLDVSANIANSVTTTTGTGPNTVTVTTSGTLQIDLGATLVLSDATITGGTVTNSGTLDLNGLAVLDPGILGNTGQINVSGTGNALDDETVTNSGTIEVLAGGVLTIDQGSTIDNNGGNITVDDASGGLGAGKLLLNDVKITGGTITDNGTIEVTGDSTIKGGATVQGGTLSIDSGVTLTLDTDTLTGLLTITGGTVDLAADTTTVSGLTTISDATVQDGTLSVDSGVTLTLDTDTLTGLTVTGGSVDLAADTTTVSGPTTISDATVQDGTLSVDSGTTLTLDTDTLIGLTITGGTVDLATDTTTVGGPTTISDATVQDGTLSVDSGTTLTLDTDTLTGLTITGGTVDLATDTTTVSGLTTISDATVQDGTLSVDSGATLTLDTDTLTGLTITGGTVDLAADTTTVSGLTTISDATVQDGTLSVDSGTTLTLDTDTLTGLTITGGTVDLAADTTTVSGLTTISDATVQDGTLSVDSGTTLTLDTDTLTGLTITGGTVDFATDTTTVSGLTTISDATVQDGMLSVDSGVTLTLDTDTLTGLTITGGTVDLDADTTTVSGATTISDATVQDGTLSVDSGVTLTLDSVTVNGGTIEATGAGSSVELYDVTIAGGTLGTGDLIDEANGLIAIEAASGANTSILDGSVNAISVAGYVQIEAGANLELIGTIDDTGVIDVDSIMGGSTTNALEIDGTVTLNGGGTVTLDGSSDQILAASSGDTLDNYDMISGFGAIGHVGNGALVLDNELGGTIEAVGGTLTVDTGQTFTNAGTIEAASGGTLVIDDAVSGTGSATISSGGVMDFEAGVASGQTISFSDGTGTLQLGYAQYFGGQITGFGVGDTIDLTNVGYLSSEYAIWTQTSSSDGGSGTLAIYSGAGTLEADLHLNGIYTQNEFALASDGASGTSGTDVHFDYYIPFTSGTINSYSLGGYTPQISNDASTLTLTNDLNQHTSWFATNMVSVTNFTASFDYQATGQADGISFVLQEVGTSALGTSDGGSGLGYNGISGSSAAVEFNIFDGHVQGTNFATDGSTGSYISTAPVDFWNGDEIQVVLSYNGSVLTETLTDLVNGSTFSTSYTENLQNILGSSSAYVGFTAGTGAEASTQTVSNFTYQESSVTGASSFTIADGASLLLNASVATGATVTFAGGTGSLVLDNPSSFNGQILGFTGTAPDPAHSDTIDLVGINYSSTHFSETYDASTGLLSVTDGSNSASLTLDNFQGTLDFASDGNGGTLITDPPANATSPSTSPVVVANGDQFVFKPSPGGAISNVMPDPGPGQTDPHHDLASLISSDQSAFTNSLASHDSLTDPNFDGAHPNWLKPVALGGVHASDFHSV